MVNRKLRDALIGIVFLGFYVVTLVAAYSAYSARGSTLPPSESVAASTALDFPR